MAPSHPALAHPDILSEIFQYLAPYPDALHALDTGYMPNPMPSERVTVPRRTLVSAALTCRAFAEPASAVLWAILPQGFGPLFYALPAFKVVVTLENPDLFQWGDFFGDPYRVEYQTLQGDISPKDWERWRHCASRVRFIRYSFNYPRWTVEEPFLSILLRPAAEGRPLLPHLKALNCPETRGDPIQMSLLRSIMSPSLSVVSINAYNPSTFSLHLADDLKMMLQASKYIKRLHIRSGYRVVHMHLPLAYFTHLRALYIAPAVSLALYQHLIRQLDALPELTELSLAIDQDQSSAQALPLQGSDKHNCVDRADAAGGFPSLRRLSIAGTPSEIHQFLVRANSAVLENISISSSQETVGEVETMFRALATERTASTLRKLFVSLETDFRPVLNGAEPLQTSFRAIAAPVLSLGSLEDLEMISWNSIVSISDEDVSQMSAAWPRLRRLEILSDVKDNFREYDAWMPHAPDIVRPSLTALVLLAERCRSLELLKIDIADVSEDELQALEARAAAIASSGDTQPCLQTRLRNLVFAHGDRCLHLALPDVERLARALRRLFPMLEGPGESAQDWSTRRRPMKHAWTSEQRNTDAFRLMERLNEV
ncbi:hypothetical protein FKP32DRAFT_1680301 [Trametes sanguinea]|nr:hypothetical protein FKP32DRAFT_1680301 [Trametes sanguinea]